MAKRKPTALQLWRQEYAEMVFTNRCAKKAARMSPFAKQVINGHIWGDFKQPQAQRLAATMKRMCREWMELRPVVAAATAAQWEEDAIKRAAKLGHPIPNTASPDNKIED
jgi:crotonobetainyl-CoA:carnitine CoA-transferase CaiB-like acyl-CoA transferase